MFSAVEFLHRESFLRAARGREEGRFASTLWLHHTINHVSIDYILLSHLVVLVRMIVVALDPVGRPAKPVPT
jgi:hypothetical protein